MIAAGEPVLLTARNRQHLVRAGQGTYSTDKGNIDLGALVGMEPGDVVQTHLGEAFTVLIPRSPDLFALGRRTGAPMMPRDIGLVIAYTGLCRDDRVLDAGTGSGVAALYFGKISRHVVSYEVRPEFAALAAENLRNAGIDTVEVICGDILEAEGLFDIVHLDMALRKEHILHAWSLLGAGGYLACYTPFIEHMVMVRDAAARLFPEIHSYEILEREMTCSPRGTRPSTRVGHTGYVTIARKYSRDLEITGEHDDSREQEGGDA